MQRFNDKEKPNQQLTSQQTSLECQEKKELSLSQDNYLAKKSLMINGFFSNLRNLHPDFKGFARKEKHLSDLILTYAGDIPYVENAQKIYDRTLLQIEHEKKSIGDDQQSKPLKIVNMNSVEERKKIADVLLEWSKTSMEQWEINMMQYDSNNVPTEDRRRLYANITFYEDVRNVISDVFREQIPDLLKNISVVMDDAGVIQAISVSAPDELNKNAWRVSDILAAPHNRIEGHPSCVKGAGSALIQDAIEHSIKRQGLNPGAPLTFEVMKNTAVTLHWTSSPRFYLNLFFEQNMGRKNSILSHKELILKEENLFKFLENYGGRATMSTQLKEKVDTVESNFRAEGTMQPRRS